jgi:hypothetical protein
MHLHLVAAQGIVAVGRAIAPVGFLRVIPRIAIVVEDYFLVEVAKIHYL